MSPADRLAQLSGKWQVARVIRHADGTTARFSGTADWSPDATGLRCDEIGSLTIGAMAPVSGNRTTLWQARDNAIAVAFADARPFHVIGPGPRPDAVFPPQLLMQSRPVSRQIDTFNDISQSAMKLRPPTVRQASTPISTRPPVVSVQ